MRDRTHERNIPPSDLQTFLARNIKLRLFTSITTKNTFGMSGNGIVNGGRFLGLMSGASQSHCDKKPRRICDARNQVVGLYPRCGGSYFVLIRIMPAVAVPIFRLTGCPY